MRVGLAVLAGVFGGGLFGKVGAVVLCRFEEEGFGVGSGTPGDGFVEGEGRV